MVDPRFFEPLGPVSAARLASALGSEASLEGDADAVVCGLAAADAAGPDDLFYLEGKAVAARREEAGVALVQRAQDAAFAKAQILTRHPRAAFAVIAPLLFAERGFGAGPALDPTAQIETGAILGAGVVIGPGAAVGAGAVIGPNTVIGPGVAIGRGAQIGPGVTIVCALVGDGVQVLAGARIGQTGFGVAVGPRGPVALPHFGRVVIQDGATIGANVTVDRGLFDDTLIGEGAHIDNLTQIAHNVRVGRGAVIAACGGISGSTVIGDGAMLGGRVGVADHRRIGVGAALGAGSLVMHDVPDGETWGGYPAKAIRRWLREVAWLQRAARGGQRE